MKVLLLSAAGLASALPLHANLTFDIVNNRDQDIYLYFANAPITGTAPASAGGGAITTNINNSDNNSYLIPANSSLNGFSISDFSSGRVFVSVGEELESGNGSQFNNPSLTDYSKRFDHFEITYSNGLQSSGANLTGTDFTSMPLQLSNGSSTVKWTTQPFSQAMANVTSIIRDKTPNQNGGAIATGPNGVNVPGIGNVVRVIAPSTAVAGADTPFGQIANYHNAMKNGLVGNLITVFSNQFGNDYSLSGSVQADGSVLLNQVNGEGTITSIQIGAEFFTSEAIYGANPSEATINGSLTQSTDFTSNEAAAIRDVYAGFNLGVWGSTEMVDKPGTNTPAPLGEFNSQEFFDLHDVAHFFSNAQSDPDYYNEFAETIAENSDNAVYGFPYSDVLGGQFITLDPGSNPTLTLTIEPDMVPEPQTYALIGGIAALGLALLRRRK